MPPDRARTRAMGTAADTLSEAKRRAAQRGECGIIDTSDAPPAIRPPHRTEPDASRAR